MVAMELAYGDPPFLARLGLDDEALDARPRPTSSRLHFLTSIRTHQPVLRYVDLKGFQARENSMMSTVKRAKGYLREWLSLEPVNEY